MRFFTRLFFEGHFNTLFLLLSFLFHYIKSCRDEKLNVKNGLEPLTRFAFMKHKKSDTLFILGSGSSINDLTSNQWNFIKDGDSIGFNFWVAHDFVPNILRFELPQEVNRREYFYKMFFEKEGAYSDKLVLFDNRPNDIIPDRLKEQIKKNDWYYPASIVMPGHTSASITRSLNFIKRINVLKRKKVMLPYKRASISTLLSLSYIMGYKKVVLCGIDLNNKKYFYENEYYSNKFPDFTSIQTGDRLISMDESIFPITIDKIIYLMNDTLFSTAYSNLYVGTKSSSLYPELPYYFDKI